MLNKKYTAGLAPEECQRLENILTRMKENNRTQDLSEVVQTPIILLYNLNRIRENDPTITSLKVNFFENDPGLTGNQLAHELKKALKTNTFIKKVEISYAHVTDDGLKPLLAVLNNRKMDSVNFSGNDLTDDTISQLTTRFMNLNKPCWRQLILRDTIAGYMGMEYADMTTMSLLEKPTGQSFIFTAETPLERDQRLARHRVSRHYKNGIPASFYIRSRE